jgi:SAM-dependent methyltransferase
MQDQPPRLFDRALVRRRFARARGPVNEALADFFAREIEERFLPITHEFEHALICGPQAAGIAAKLRRFRSTTIQNRHAVFDEEALPFAPASFDCVVSVGALQSVNDLPGALVQLRQALKPDGLLLAAIFAGQTLAELRRAWLEAEAEHFGGATPRVAPMADLRDLAGLLQRAGFALPVADLDRTTLRYGDALALMREIKAAGFSSALAVRSRTPVSRALLAAAATRYPADADGRISATIEIAWLTAWAPGANQPKPLKPGSARARLADALGAIERPLPRE